MPHSTGNRSTVKTLPPLAWVSPDSELWVANTSGEYAGMVEFLDGHFEVRDPTGHVLGHCSSLAEAKQLVQISAEESSTLLGLVQQTLHRVGDTLAGGLVRRVPHYRRTA